MSDDGFPLEPPDETAALPPDAESPKPRRAPKPKEPPRRHSPVRLVLLAVAAVALLSSPWWGRAAMRRMAFFRVRRVQVIGARFVPPDEIVRRLGVDTTASVWDPAGPLEARVMAHAEVLSAKVERRLPGTLVVRVAERVPVALVAAQTGLVPYDERGVALPIDPARTLVDAPVLDRADVSLIRLLAGLRAAAPELFARVSDVSRVGGDELVVRLDHLPVRTMYTVTADRLLEVQPVERDLARRQLVATELDLRYRDQVIARIQ